MKNRIKIFLQNILGYGNYLFLLSIFTIWRLRSFNHEREFLHFMNMIPNEGVVLDIGANIGAMAISLAKELKNTTVYAFEPIPDNMMTLKRVAKYYNITNIKLFETALGKENGTINMVVPIIDRVKTQGLSHVVKEGGLPDPDAGTFYSIPIKKLDDIEELNQLPKISAIKIDVENFEYNVFQGGRELLKRHKPVIYCELWANETRDLCVDYLSELGYSAKVYDGMGLVTYTDQYKGEVNFFFVQSSQ